MKTIVFSVSLYSSSEKYNVFVTYHSTSKEIYGYIMIDRIINNMISNNVKVNKLTITKPSIYSSLMIYHIINKP